MKYDLEDRLIKFSIVIIKMTSKMKTGFTSEHLSKQIIKSSTSSALNYGEAQSGESHRDFIHKMKICLKELRETFINLKIIEGAELINNLDLIKNIKQENNELISIFVTSIRTSNRKNRQ
ncbi:MAG: four helix bundle protein [Flavobacteriaceae bacterium]|nr:four helix bundle protein [Flavobacteriaceae bacterium]